MKSNNITSIRTYDEQIEELNNLKIIPQEPLHSVIKRLIDLKKLHDKKFKNKGD